MGRGERALTLDLHIRRKWGYAGRVECAVLRNVRPWQRLIAKLGEVHGHKDCLPRKFVSMCISLASSLHTLHKHRLHHRE